VVRWAFDFSPHDRPAGAADAPVSRRAPLRFVGATAIFAFATGFNAIAVAQAPQPAAPPSTAEPTVSPPINGASLLRFAPDHLFRILGRDVMSATGEDMGRIVDVLFDDRGTPRAAVIDFGGFLGVGTRKIAIDWSALRFNMGEKKNIIALDLGREQLKAAPEYKESDKPIAVVTLPQSDASEPAAEPGR
jgi:hypothetical protein